MQLKKLKTRLIYTVNSKTFKKAVFFLGIAFFFLTFFITFSPQPFLRFGYLGVFIFNLFGPGTFLFPALSKFMNIPLLAGVTALGMMFNDSVAWLVGITSDSLILPSKKLDKIRSSIEKYGPWALFFWSLIPFPYDFVGFVAGYLKMPYKKYVIPTFSGKFVRFILMGYGLLKIFSFSAK